MAGRLYFLYLTDAGDTVEVIILQAKTPHLFFTLPLQMSQRRNSRLHRMLITLHLRNLIPQTLHIQRLHIGIIKRRRRTRNRQGRRDNTGRRRHLARDF